MNPVGLAQEALDRGRRVPDYVVMQLLKEIAELKTKLAKRNQPTVIILEDSHESEN